MDSVSRKYPASAYLKLFLLPLIGIVAFFINIPLPEYTVMGVTVASNSTIVVNHLARCLRALLWDGNVKVMPYVVLAIAFFGLADLIIRRKKYFKNTLNKAFSVMKCVGVVFLLFVVLGFGPAIMHEARDALGGRSISAFVMNNILIAIIVSVPLATIFLPFLINYGLVEFVGVLARPIMRPLFKLPGCSAIIMISSLFGNFSVGHLAVNEYYESGRMTEKEAMAICTGFCSSSIAFKMVLANNSNIMDHWNAYYWSTIFLIILTTFIGVRLFPLTRIKDDYAPDIKPQPENEYKNNLLKRALEEGLEVSQASLNPAKTIAHIQKATFTLLAGIIMGAGFSTSAGMLLYFYTPIFGWLGYIFQPFVWLVRIPSSEVATAATGAAISLLEVTIPSLMVSVGDWSVHVRYMLAVVPMTSIIFLGSFVPSLLGTNLPVKFRYLLLIWVERMILSVLFSGIFALLMFGMPA